MDGSRGPEVMHLEAERGEEPLVLARGVLLLEDGLDLLLGLLALRRLLEGLLRNGTLEALELESVTGGHEVVVRDDLDERLDLGALGNLLGPHALGHLLRVSLDTSGNNVGESLLLGAVIELLDDDNLFVAEAMDAGRMSVKAVLKSRCGTNDERAYPRGARAAESEFGQHHSDGNGWRGGCDS